MERPKTSELLNGLEELDSGKGLRRESEKRYRTIRKGTLQRLADHDALRRMEMRGLR